MKEQMLEELLEVRKILSKKNKWCKGKLFKRDYINNDISFCLLGALMHVDQENKYRSHHIAEPYYEVMCECSALLTLTIQRMTKTNVQLEEYNDLSSTTHSDIIKVLDLSIAELEEGMMTS